MTAANEVSELVEKLRFGCPFKPYTKENGVGAYDVTKAERIMLAAAALIERQQQEIAQLQTNYASAVRGRQQFRERYRVARDALQVAEAAINPPDRGGINMDVWNQRLKAATAAIHVALTSPTDTKEQQA